MKTETTEEYLKRGGNVTKVRPGHSTDPMGGSFKTKLRRSIERSVNKALAVRKMRAQLQRKLKWALDIMYLDADGEYNTGTSRKEVNGYEWD